MEANNPELQEKLRELEHELEVSWKYFQYCEKCFNLWRVHCCVLTRGAAESVF
jgi:hypothetical protein